MLLRTVMRRATAMLATVGISVIGLGPVAASAEDDMMRYGADAKIRIRNSSSGKTHVIVDVVAFIRG
jgi:hypothetical protein